MHSIREVAGVKDHYFIIRLFEKFYNV